MFEEALHGLFHGDEQGPRYAPRWQLDGINLKDNDLPAIVHPPPRNTVYSKAGIMVGVVDQKP